MDEPQRHPPQARPVRPPQSHPTPDPASNPSPGPGVDELKVVVAQWTGGLACALWIATRDNIHDFAGWLGVAPSTIEAWKDNPDILPTPTNQRVLDEALCRLDAEATHRFAILTSGNRLVWVSDSSAANQNRNDQNGDDANRRDLNKAAAAVLAGALAPPELWERITLATTRSRPVDNTLIADHEQFADILASHHRTTRPDVLIGQVTHHADTLLALLDRPLGVTQRRRLEATTVGTCAQAGLLALYLCDRIGMRHCFGLAEQIAHASGDPTLQAQAAAVSSLIYSSTQTDGHHGDINQALRLKRQAADHARKADAATFAWTQRWLAEELAAAGDEPGFRHTIHTAQHLSGQPTHQDGRGFFAHYLALTPEQANMNWGAGLVRLGHPDEAIDILQATLTEDWPGWTLMTLTDIAAARVLQHEPEHACHNLTHALALARHHGDPMGIQRIHTVRHTFHPTWTPLPCVQHLDHTLQHP
jgi:hypothetical protein